MEQDILDKPFLPLDRLRILKYFSVYSVIITITLIALYFADITLGFLGLHDPKIYPMVLSLHASITIVFLAMAFSAGQAHYDHLIAFFLLDISLIAGLIYSSGSGNSLSYLMIVGIAVGNSLVTGQKGLLLSAWGAICLLFVENRFAVEGQNHNYVNAGTLGLIFFITAFVIQSLVKRLHLSVGINLTQADSLLSLEQLTKLVLKRLDTGVLVINPENEIIFQNRSAQRLLGYPGPIRELPHKLQKSLQQYLKYPSHKPAKFKAGPTTAKVQPMFAELMPGANQGSVVFIEDTNVIYQQAQRLKQISLGKLAASIVREIREPMQGIYQIATKMSLVSAAKEDIARQENIKNHSQHIERIISNVQDLSNSKNPEFKQYNLVEWTRALLKRLDSTILNSVQLELKLGKGQFDVFFDESQMGQVLSNVLENAAYFSKAKDDQKALITILIGRNKNSQDVVMEIQDNGNGVLLDDLDHIFEPFYSSEKNKSGLGLYLSKQFCEMNMARLDHVAVQQGARFRITFPPVDYMQQIMDKRQEFALRDSSNELK